MFQAGCINGRAATNLFFWCNGLVFSHADIYRTQRRHMTTQLRRTTSLYEPQRYRSVLGHDAHRNKGLEIGGICTSVRFWPNCTQTSTYFRGPRRANAQPVPPRWFVIEGTNSYRQRRRTRRWDYGRRGSADPADCPPRQAGPEVLAYLHTSLPTYPFSRSGSLGSDTCMRHRKRTRSVAPANGQPKL